MAKPGKITPREREVLPGCMLPLLDRHLGHGMNSQAFDSVKGGVTAGSRGRKRNLWFLLTP